MEETLSRGEQTRNAILQAAHDLFVQQGYHGTSMRQIALQAGIALGGLYNHFASKEDVFQAVFFTYHPYHEILPLIAESQGENLDALIRDAARRMVEVVEDRPDFMNLMFIEVVEFKSTHAQQLMVELLPRGLAILQRLVQVGAGQIRPIPPLIVVRSFLGLFFAYYITDLIFAQASPPEFRQNAMDHFLEIYLHGLLLSPEQV
jgi:AcrR family transcriptional regulator